MRSQAWARGGGFPPWKCYKVFCALVVTVKRSATIYASFSQFFVGFWEPGFHPWTRWGTFVSIPPNLPTPGKNPASAHGPQSTFLSPDCLFQVFLRSSSSAALHYPRSSFLAMLSSLLLTVYSSQFHFLPLSCCSPGARFSKKILGKILSLA